MPGPYATLPGRRHPLGATVEDEGVNFSVYSRHATGAELLLYEDAWALEPFQIIGLDPEVQPHLLCLARPGGGPAPGDPLHLAHAGPLRAAWSMAGGSTPASNWWTPGRGR